MTKDEVAISSYIFTGICDENTCPYLGQVCRVAADGKSPECACRCQGPECLAPGVMCDTNGKTHESFAAFAVWKCESQNYEVERDYWGACEGDYVVSS